MGQSSSVQENAKDILYVGDTILSINGQEPYNILYDVKRGDIIHMELIDRNISMRAGEMDEYFGIQKCFGDNYIP